MLNFITRRLGLLAPTFFGVTLLTFALIHLIPGDPAEMMMGGRCIDPQVHAEVLHRLGLDKPLYQQYLGYVGNLARGSLGESLTTREDVWHEFLTLSPAILELSLAAILFVGTFGLLTGVIAVLERSSLFDHGVMMVSLVGYLMPIFWWGLTLIMLFSVPLGWTPMSGRLNLFYDIEPETGFMLIDVLLPDEQGPFLDAVRHLILPIIALGTIPLAVIVRATRSAMLKMLREDYVRTIRAEGLLPTRVVFVHVLHSVLVPVLTIFGPQVGTLLIGAVLTGTISPWPSIGKWLVDTISCRDYPVVQGGIPLIATLVVLVNSVVNILYDLVNPCICHQR